jgi:hypothetical protein
MDILEIVRLVIGSFRSGVFLDLVRFIFRTDKIVFNLKEMNIRMNLLIAGKRKLYLYAYATELNLTE